MVLASETTESQEEHAKISSNSSNERPAVSGKRKYTQGMINKLVEAKIKSVTIFMKKKKTKSVTRTEFFFLGVGGGGGGEGGLKDGHVFQPMLWNVMGTIKTVAKFKIQSEKIKAFLTILEHLRC